MAINKKNVTTAAYLDNAVKRDGSQTIYLRMTIDRKMRTFHSGISIPAKYWNKDKQLIKLNVKGLANARELADNLKSQKETLEKAILHIQAKGETVTFEAVKRILENENGKSFVGYCKWRMDKETGIRKASTIVKYRTYIRRIEKFDAEVDLLGITPRWLEGFHNSMLALGFAKNTIWAQFSYIKKIMAYATKHGDIPKNPFILFENPKGEKVEKTYLEKEELMRLLKLFQNGDLKRENLPEGHKYKKRDRDWLHEALQVFLASCFTGLRYSDISALTHANFSKESINVVMEKTQGQIKIPISEPLRTILNLKDRDKPLFLNRMIDNVKINRVLREIGELAKLDKHITFHSSRHTFAIIGLEVGIPIDVVSNLLGHTKITTTQIYARVVDQRKKKEMQKMDVFMQ